MSIDSNQGKIAEVLPMQKSASWPTTKKTRAWYESRRVQRNLFFESRATKCGDRNRLIHNLIHNLIRHFFCQFSHGQVFIQFIHILPMLRHIVIVATVL